MSSLKKANARKAQAHERQIAKLFNERFPIASNQLGHDSPAVRLAGVHALASLADNALTPGLRQMVINVMCAYLRMPYTPDPGDDGAADKRLLFAGLREVRHTIIRIIASHLRDGAAVSWRDHIFDLSGVVFDGGDFSAVEFSKCVIDFRHATFSGGTVDFRHATFSGNMVLFNSAVFSGGTVDFRGAEFSDGTIDFFGSVFYGGRLDFRHAMFSGGKVDFGCAVLYDGTIDFFGSVFSGGRVNFSGTEFYDGTVDLRHATFAGGTVWFRNAREWWRTPTMRESVPAGVLLPVRQQEAIEPEGGVIGTVQGGGL
ncbi:pentapeptide repeat-containing protein [Planobispora rosea]|uniref:pentapeptide repeat-containing protein n=1 Tax=Planobispora rosea TaxID=35762 RepID=UPI00159EFCE3|nr:pentapeptide repeat-containing protein [Planobispora rosea]